MCPPPLFRVKSKLSGTQLKVLGVLFVSLQKLPARESPSLLKLSTLVTALKVLVGLVVVEPITLLVVTCYDISLVMTNFNFNVMVDPQFLKLLRTK